MGCAKGTDGPAGVTKLARWRRFGASRPEKRGFVALGGRHEALPSRCWRDMARDWGDSWGGLGGPATAQMATAGAGGADSVRPMGLAFLAPALRRRPGDVARHVGSEMGGPDF